MKVSILASEYEDVKKIGNTYIVHLDKKNVEDDMIECYECSVNEEPNLEELNKELASWKEYISNIILKNAKLEKIKEINDYDSSDNVNSFIYKGVEMWLDKLTRSGLIMRLNAEKAIGKTETTLWFGTMSFTLGIDDGLQLLTLIEVYASACYDNTASHIAAVEALNNIEDVYNYDYTVGYPQKVVVDGTLVE